MRSRPSKLLEKPAEQTARRPPSDDGGAIFGGGGMSVTEFLESCAKPRAPSGSSGRLKPIQVAIASAKARSESGEWADADAATLVGLYAYMHRLVYQVDPVELEEKGNFTNARAAAGNALKRLFNGDVEQVVEFMKWSWKRERERAAYAVNQGRDRNRMSWKWQWSSNHVVDWRAQNQARRILGNGKR